VQATTSSMCSASSPAAMATPSWRSTCPATGPPIRGGQVCTLDLAPCTLDSACTLHPPIVASHRAHWTPLHLGGLSLRNAPSQSSPAPRTAWRAATAASTPPAPWTRRARAAAAAAAATHFAVCHFGMSYRQHNRPYSNTKVLVKCWCKFAVCHIILCRPEAQGWNLRRERFWSDGLGSPGAVQRP
jgi:hypothetical protein